MSVKFPSLSCKQRAIRNSRAAKQKSLNHHHVNVHIHNNNNHLTWVDDSRICPIAKWTRNDVNCILTSNIIRLRGCGALPDFPRPKIAITTEIVHLQVCRHIFFKIFSFFSVISFLVGVPKHVTMSILKCRKSYLWTVSRIYGCFSLLMAARRRQMFCDEKHSQHVMSGWWWHRWQIDPPHSVLFSVIKIISKSPQLSRHKSLETFRWRKGKTFSIGRFSE